MPAIPFARTALLSWLLLVSVVLWEDRGILRTPLYEQADDAANALSISRAKHGTEIYGNYSRFEFRHPGPAFVYVYAAGEAILEDTLGLVAPRQNAHLATGILLQAAFLALAIGIAASHSGSPFRATLLLTGVALLHFAFVPGCFSQIWPPLVLIMPFALFCVAAASVAVGRTENALWLALAAAFLLHGHIAQFLLVGGVLALLLGLAARRSLAGDPLPFPTRGRCAAVALIGAMTVLPWIIDALRGRESNLMDIWLHMKRSDGDPLRPGWLAAVADTASYFCYCSRQDGWFSPGAALGWRQFIQSCGAGGLAGTAGITACGLTLWRGRASRGSAAVFQRQLAGVCALAVVLCVVWARRQDGGATFFNSLFIFGLMMAMWVIPVLTLAEAAPGWAVGAAAALLAGGVALEAGRYGRMPDYMEGNTIGREAAVAVPRSLAREAHPERAKLLLFAHDDWDQAVSVAAALDRMGIRSFVPQSSNGDWKVMFGEDHLIVSLGQARALGPFSWWRPAPGRRPGSRLVDDLRDDFPTGQPSRFPFAFDLRHPAESFGLSAPEDGRAWTESRVVFIRLWSETAGSDVRMKIRGIGLPVHHQKFQRLRIQVNGTALPEIRVGPLSDYSVTVPRDCWNGGSPAGLVELAWELPDAVRLAAQPHSKYMETRLLGIYLHSLGFELTAPGPAAERPIAR